MPLINPTPADFLDRMSILELKVQHGESAEKDVSHFVRERAAIISALATSRVKLEHAVAITAINARLWYAEDRMRAYRNEGIVSHNQADIADLAFTIQELNDQRAELIATVNRQTGEPTPPEKLT